MRTTVTLDDHLLAKLKKRASQSNRSVSHLIEQAIRLLMQPPGPARRKESFKLVTFGAGGRFSRRNIDRISSLIEADDVDRFARQR